MTEETHITDTAPARATIMFRAPSTISPMPATFSPPHIHFLAGPWHVTHSTLPMWRSNKNVVITYTPVSDEANPLIDDLVTYNPTNNPSKQKSVRGIDTPQGSTPGSYQWRGKGWLKIASSKWEVIGWGEDEGGWCVTYFAKTLFTPAGIDVYSRGAAGPSADLLARIKDAMAEVQDQAFAKLSGAIFQIQHDSE